MPQRSKTVFVVHVEPRRSQLLRGRTHDTPDGRRWTLSMESPLDNHRARHKASNHMIEAARLTFFAGMMERLKKT